MTTRRMKSERPTSSLRCVELSPDMWPSLQSLFGRNGACGGCWCMWWRVERGGKLWDETRGPKAKRMFKKLVTAGGARGILAFDSAVPVGWCAYGPRTEFPRLNRVKAYQRDDQAEVWSINCFYIARSHRGQGVARALLQAAVKACRAHGAKIVEGYPVTTTKDGRPLAAAFAWTGPQKIFDEEGFEVVQATPPTKPLVRLKLSKATGRR